MRHLLPLALVSSLSLPVASAQDAQPAPTPPAPPPATATGSAQNSGSGSASGSVQESAATADAQPKVVKRGKARKAKKKKAIKGPVANFPSFRVLPDGSSRINLEVSEKVIVAERKAEGRLAYRLKNTQVPVSTNLLPLETSFFKTPVGRVMLVEVSEEDVELVVELRQPSEATHRIVETDQGMILQVDFPAPASQAQAPKPTPAK